MRSNFRVYKPHVQTVTGVSVSRLRQHLPSYRKRVQQGEAIQITCRCSRVTPALRAALLMADRRKSSSSSLAQSQS